MKKIAIVFLAMLVATILFASNKSPVKIYKENSICTQETLKYVIKYIIQYGEKPIQGCSFIQGMEKIEDGELRIYATVWHYNDIIRRLDIIIEVHVMIKDEIRINQILITESNFDAKADTCIHRIIIKTDKGVNIVNLKELSGEETQKVFNEAINYLITKNNIIIGSEI